MKTLFFIIVLIMVSGMAFGLLTFDIFAGDRISDLVAELEEQGIVSVETFTEIALTTSLVDYPFIPENIHGLQKFEGIFVPGTYTLDFETENEELLAINIMRQLLFRAKKRFDSLTEVKYLSPYELIILASVVEKEDAFDTHASVIASVFWNRLDKGGRLASCPTVEYVLGYHRPFLLYVDLEAAASSPWSTYSHSGLMPTPICFVSDYTLDATIHPDDTDYWFFVMDWAKQIPYLTASYEEHKKNIIIARSNVIKTFGSDILHKKMKDYYYDYFATISREQ